MGYSFRLQALELFLFHNYNKNKKLRNSHNFIIIDENESLSFKRKNMRFSSPLSDRFGPSYGASLAGSMRN